MLLQWKASIGRQRIGTSLAFFLFLSCPSFGQCSIPPNDQLKPFNGGEDKPSGHFEWYSAAGPNPTQGGHASHVFQRKVTNLSKTTTLKYYWADGRMQNDALPAGNADSFCPESGWPNQKDGQLDYGRGNANTPTTVWEGKDEPLTSIRSSFTFHILDKADTVRTVTIQVESSVQPTSKAELLYSYAFINMSKEAVTLKWDIDEDVPLVQELRREHLSPTFSIEKGDAVKIGLYSALRPAPGFRSVNILMDKEQRAAAGVPILLPKDSF